MKVTLQKEIKLINVITILINLSVFSFAQKELGEFSKQVLQNLSKSIIPPLENKRKGEAGKIGVIGGSVEYTGAPYFAAISALKTGADLVYVITTENAAPIIKSYSPDLIVYPMLNADSMTKIKTLLPKMDVIVIGPGYGREKDNLKLMYEIIETCKQLRKPLVIDADGLYGVAKNISIIKDYPDPGVILTPNHFEKERLRQATPSIDLTWHRYWGPCVSILEKGEKDQFYTNSQNSGWSSSEGGSRRRAGGQGDILSGALGTFMKWALDSIENSGKQRQESISIAHSLATYSAARLTRTCNSKAFALYGRSMTASNMLKEIHSSFDELFI